MNDFLRNVVKHTGLGELRGRGLETIQVNLGLRCNLQCHHCHVGASPTRREEMGLDIMEKVLDLVDRSHCRVVDLTGGAPELNPRLRFFIQALRQRGVKIQLRTNLTIHLEPEVAGLATFLRDHHVALVGSMPCYLERNVDAQRGQGVYQRSIAAIRLLNDLGYGTKPQWPLNLVYNPAGPSLPPAQCKLEADYRRELYERHRIVFSNLLTITNVPIGRFRANLRQQGEEVAYWNLLHQSFNPKTLENLMCRNQISVAWDGVLFDCDFNLALDQPAELPDSAHIDACDPKLLGFRSIATGNHCFACTAGSGSSCAGSLVA